MAPPDGSPQPYAGLGLCRRRAYHYINWDTNWTARAFPRAPA